MKIAVVHNYHSSESPSGENVVVDAEIAALRSAGIKVHVASLRNDDFRQTLLGRPRAAITAATGLGISPVPMFDDFEPDIIHCHNLFPHFGTRWARHITTPIVSTLHSYRPMCSNGYFYRDGAVCLECLGRNGWPAIRHGCYRDSRLQSIPPALKNNVHSNEVLMSARKNLVLSDRSMELFAQAGVPEQTLERDWHFVPKELVSQPVVQRSDHWLFVGRLSSEKGIDMLLAEWPPDERLVVIGDGSLRKQLAHYEASKSVVFKGNLPREHVLEEMQRAFGLVMPSRWYETFGLIYIEALSAGLPTLAFPPNVVADAVKNEGTGVVGAWDRISASLADARRSFEELRGHCREVFSSQYSEEAWIRRRVNLYKRVVGESNAGKTGQ